MSAADIVNSTIIGMRWYTGDDGVKVLQQKRYFTTSKTFVWEPVEAEVVKEIPWTERFANDDLKPHSIVPRNTENIVKEVSKISGSAMSEFYTEPEAKAVEARLCAMLIRVCGGDVDHVRDHGVYFNGNAMGMDLVRFMMVAYGGKWGELVDKLHLGSKTVSSK